MNALTMREIPVIDIPAVGRVPAYCLDPMNKEQVRVLIQRADAYFELSKKAWEARQERMSPERYAMLEARENRMAGNGEKLLAVLGIKCDWPGLYPSFRVNGYHEYTTEAAVLAALGHARNWLR